MATQFNAKKIDETSKYIVLDDIDLDFFPNYKAFFGAQKEFEVTDKYVRKMTVHWGKPCIWLSNENPLDKKVDREWVIANTTIVHVEEPLYEVEPIVAAPLSMEDLWEQFIEPDALEEMFVPQVRALPPGETYLEDIITDGDRRVYIR